MSSSFEDLQVKYYEFIQYNINPNNTNKATVNIHLKNFTIEKFKNTEDEMIQFVTYLGDSFKENNKKYNNLGTVVLHLKNISRKNFNLRYFSKVYKVIDKIFYKEDIVDKIICFCNSPLPVILFKMVKTIMDPMTVKKFVFYKV